MTVKVNCSECGKEFEIDEKLKNWCENKNVPIRCSSCYSSTKATTKATTKVTTKVTSQINPEDFEEVYNKFCSVFADRLEEVHDYLGAWVTTVLLSRRK